MPTISSKGVLLSEFMLRMCLDFTRSASPPTGMISIESILVGLSNVLTSFNKTKGMPEDMPARMPEDMPEDMLGLLAPFMGTDQGIDVLFAYLVPVVVNRYLLQRHNAGFSAHVISIAPPIQICSMVARTQHALSLDMYTLHSTLSIELNVHQQAIWKLVIAESIIETHVFNEGSVISATNDAMVIESITPGGALGGGAFSTASAFDVANSFGGGNTSSSSSSSGGANIRPRKRSKRRKRPRTDGKVERELKKLLKPFTTEGMELLFVHVVPIIVHFVLCRGFELEE